MVLSYLIAIVLTSFFKIDKPRITIFPESRVPLQITCECLYMFARVDFNFNLGIYSLSTTYTHSRTRVDFNFNLGILTRYELRRCMRARTRAICGRTCACACKIHSLKCAGCACVRPFFGRAVCDCTFAHFLRQNCQKMLLFALKTILGLKCPIPF